MLTAFFVDMGHSYPRDDPGFAPVKSWQDVTMAYFLTHPLGYQTRYCEPPFWTPSFRDEFDRQGTAMDGEIWRYVIVDPE